MPDAMAAVQAFQCVWQNVWAWSCQGTAYIHNFWVWEPSGLIRSAATDSFLDWPFLCMDMCQDFSVSSGACSMTAGTSLLNVGWQQCTGHANQACTLRQQGSKVALCHRASCPAVLHSSTRLLQNASSLF